MRESCVQGWEAADLQGWSGDPLEVDTNSTRADQPGIDLEGWLALASGESLLPHRAEKGPCLGYLMEAKTWHFHSAEALLCQSFLAQDFPPCAPQNRDPWQSI